MKLSRFALLYAGAVLGLGAVCVVAQTPEQVFAKPPAEARPMVRWWWFGAAVVKPEILRELEQMKADGIGDAELAFVYPEVLDDPAKGLKNLPFLSPEMLDAVTYAQAEGRRLGLRVDVTLCSGWPYGGPATTLEEASTRLRTAEVAVEPNGTSVATPALQQGETLLASVLVNGTPTPAPVRRGPGAAGGPPVAPASTWDATTARRLALAQGTTTIEPSTKPRVALFFIQSHTRQEVKRAAVGAEGWVLDPFSKQAVATHLKAVGEPLVGAFGKTPPYAIFSDSLEAYGADWTPTLPAEFSKRRGYDLLEHLPELVAGGSPAAEKVRHDYGVTLTELVNENYLTQINDWARAHGTKFRSQTYGQPAVSFSSQRLAALPEGEGPQWRAFSTLRWATSANHVFGNTVTSGETFTWLHSPVFRATPLDMKTEADIDFIMGENQLIFHGWPYSAPPMPDGTPEVPEPGWSLYAAASFNNHNPWHPVMPQVTGYIARLSALMRQGEPANQVAILLPTDDAWASFKPGNDSITGEMARLVPQELQAAILSAGYNLDYIDAEAINLVGLGTHSLLVIPPTDRIPVATIRKIDAFVKAGGHVLAVGRGPSMDPDGRPNAELTQLASGFTLVKDVSGLPTALLAAATPDLKLAATDAATRDAIGFIRRRTAAGDTYFVVNTSNQAIDTTVAFGTAKKYGVALDPDSMAASAAQVVGQSLRLAPYESRVFLFSDAASTSKPATITAGVPLADLSGDWKVKFVGSGKEMTEASLTDWTANPDTLHYSGEAVYARDFTYAATGGRAYLEIDGGEALPMPRKPGDPPVLLANGLPDPRVTRPGPGMHAYFNPPVREAALVTINGKPAGALWHPPYRLDVSALVKAGTNHIEIHVFNTALNAWSALPPHDYAPLIAKYGDRFQMQDLNLVKPVSSGIVGTVKLVSEGGTR